MLKSHIDNKSTTRSQYSPWCATVEMIKHKCVCIHHMLRYFWVWTSCYLQHPTPVSFLWGALIYKIVWYTSKRPLRKLKASPFCPTGAWVCCSRWTRATSWTWSTSQSGSSPSPSPAVWRSRATPPTCGRSPPCCAPNTATTTWYSSLCVFSSGKCCGPTPRRNESFPDQPFVSWSLSQFPPHMYKLFAQQRPYVTSLNSSTFLLLSGLLEVAAAGTTAEFLTYWNSLLNFSIGRQCHGFSRCHPTKRQNQEVTKGCVVGGLMLTVSQQKGYVGKKNILMLLTLRAAIFCSIMWLLQATREHPGGVLSSRNCNSVGKGHGKQILRFVSSLLKAIGKEEGGKKINSYCEPTEKDWSSFLSLGNRLI